MRRGTPRAWLPAMPAFFVLLWSTGFIGAKLGLPYAEPFTFLLWRFGILVLILVPVALVTRAPWPGRTQTMHIAVAGLLVHGVYLGGVFSSLHGGVPAGLSALIAGLQPLLTALAAGPLLGERVTARQWAGLLLGLAGVGLVLSEKVSAAAGGGLFQGFDMWALGLSVAALVGITLGTLYQKKYCTAMDLRTGSAIQFASSAVLMAVLAAALETGEVQWTGEFVFALGWLVVVLSLGAISLLMVLIKAGEVARVASLFYLVPPVTAFIAYLVFGEVMGLSAILGMAVAVVGVSLVNRR